MVNKEVKINISIVVMELIPFLVENNIPFEKNVPLFKKTWIKTGGLCACWIMPISVEQLKDVCKYLYTNGMTFDLVGQTSNIFFHSTYNPQVVVSTIKVNGYKIDGDTIFCECGVSVVKLAKDCLSQGYAGFYGLVGLPGTVASAVVNNAGCFKCSISSMLVSAELLQPDGRIETILKEDFRYSHRSSAFKRGEKKGIILSVKLKVEKANDIEEEQRKSEETVVYRKEKQEQTARNLGSIYSKIVLRKNFRNNIVRLIMKLLPSKAGLCPQFVKKKLILLLYGYCDLNNYVSEKQINTFIWKDSDSENKFIRYKEMMNKIFSDSVLEIEEKV